jgi:hypothetical protein
VELGDRYYTGQGVRQNYAQAMDWYRKAAAQGNADAQLDIGGMYQRAVGVPQDYRQALLWFQKAADQGSSRAQYRLGQMYSDGQGVPRDYAQARSWYQKAADQGDADAKSSLISLYSKQMAEIVENGGRPEKQLEISNVVAQQAVSDPRTLYTSAVDRLRRTSVITIQGGTGATSIQFAAGTAAAFLAVIRADPTGIWGTETRVILMTKGIWPDWDGQLPPGNVPAQRPCGLDSNPDPGQLPCALKAEMLIAQITGKIPPVQQNAVVANQNAEERQSGIAGLQQQITQLESDAEDADNRAVDLERSGDPIERIGAIHLRNQAKSDRRRAESLRSNLAQLDAQAAAATPSAAPAPPEPVDDPNAILNAGNRQAAAMRAIGDANAQQQQNAARQRQATQQVAANQNSLSSTQNSGQNSNSSTHDTYAPALDASCVHPVWDANSYGWLAFDNACGRKISLLVLLNDNTHFGGSSPGLNILEPGERLNTTTTREAVQAHKGYTMYACPYPMSAVGPDKKLVEEINVSSYRCWRP